MRARSAWPIARACSTRRCLRPERLSGVLAVVYLVFTEGHLPGSGEAAVREDLCAEAIRLGRVLAELMPDEPEALGLLALMLLHDARRDARTDSDGHLVLLEDQDRRRWDQARLVRVFLREVVAGRVDVGRLITDVVDAPEVASAFERLDRGDPSTLQVVLRFDGAP